MSYLRGSGANQQPTIVGIFNEVLTMKTTARFTFDAVRHDQENEVHLVVSLKAPKKDWETKRPPVCVFPVIDTSTSMSGQKLDYAKKSALKRPVFRLKSRMAIS